MIIKKCSWKNINKYKYFRCNVLFIYCETIYLEDESIYDLPSDQLLCIITLKRNTEAETQMETLTLHYEWNSCVLTLVKVEL